jgi:hypothetical protein
MSTSSKVSECASEQLRRAGDEAAGIPGERPEGAEAARDELSSAHVQ